MTIPEPIAENISAEQISNDIKELIFKVHVALEDAPRLAKLFFEKQNQDIDPFLVNDIIRYYVKRYLLDLDFDVTESYKVDDLANNGLSVRYNGYHVRILKADHGDLPIPGVSETKKLFYNQQLSMDLYNSDTNLRRLKPNVLILWDLSSSYDLSQLYLACPKSGGKTRESVSSYFNNPLEHAAYLIKPDKVISEDQQEEDIDIRRIDVPNTENTLTKEHNIGDNNDIWGENPSST